MRTLLAFLALVGFALCQGGMMPGPGTVHSVAAPSATLVHHWQSSSCVAPTCSVTITGGMTAGNLVVITSSLLKGTSGPYKITGVSASAGTMTECGIRNGDDGNVHSFSDCVYVKQADSLTFAGPLVVTYGGGDGGAQVNIREYSTANGTLSFDAGADMDDNGTGGTFSGPTVTLTGTQGVQVAWAGTSTDAHISSVASPWNTNADFASDKTGWGTADLLNSAFSAPSWTFTGTPSGHGAAEVNFSFGSTPCTYMALMDSHSGADGNAPTVANLNSSTAGATGMNTLTEGAGWVVANNASNKITYSTSAYHALASAAPRFCVGGTTYSDSSSVGLRYTTTNSLASYLLFKTNPSTDWTGQTSSNTSTLTGWFRTTLLGTDTLNVDAFAIHGSGTGGTTAFVNTILGTSGGNLQIALEGSGSSAVTITTNTWYQLALKYIAGGTGVLQIYDSSGSQVGSDQTVSLANGPVTEFQLGDTNGFALTAGKFIDFDKIKFCYAGACSFPELE